MPPEGRFQGDPFWLALRLGAGPAGRAAGAGAGAGAGGPGGCRDEGDDASLGPEVGPASFERSPRKKTQGQTTGALSHETPTPTGGIHKRI